MAKFSQNWDRFVQGLIQTKTVDGISLLTQHGVCVYSYGVLENTDEVKWSQFRGLFGSTCEKYKNKVFSDGFQLNLAGTNTNSFTVYKKTHCSIYATNEGGRNGLVICNLPYGILVCTYSHPQPAGHVINTVERFCDSLRA